MFRNAGALTLFGTLAMSAAAPAGAQQLEDNPFVQQLQRQLRQYVTAQEAYLVDHGRYAGGTRAMRFTHEPGVTLVVLSSSVTGHRGLARHDDAPGTVCAIWIGSAPAPLGDRSREGEPSCRDYESEVDSAEAAELSERLQRNLSDYAVAQETFLADQGTYAASHEASGFTASDDVIVVILTSTATGHSAIAIHEEVSDLVCAIWIGTARPPLGDGAAERETTCRSAR